jgi:hypothetical protein
MDKTRMIWIGLAALIAVPVLAQTGAITPPPVKPAEPAKPTDPAKPAEKAREPSKEAIAVADSFGGSFSSGAVVFGGGDSPRLQAQELLKKKAEDEKKTVI